MRRERTSATTLLAAAALFFLSGALGLGYELVWIRKAALLVGASQIALATVLTSFFVGLGLGSLFVGRRLRSRRRSPLFVYGLFEAAIGLFALAFPWLFRGIEGAYAVLYPVVDGHPVSLFLTRFALLFGLILPPTFFMGGTLPLLLDGLVDRDRVTGGRTSLLYGANILGAVAGVLATGYLLIPRLGLDGTSLLCGAGNLSIAVLALVSFRRLPPLHPPPGDPARQDRLPRLFAVLGFASGLVAIGYQIAWARYFGLFQTASVYLTTVLLAVFLGALALGSLALAPILTRRVSGLRVVAVTQSLVPSCVLFGLGAWRLADHGFRPAPAAETGEVVPSWFLIGERIDAILVAPLLQVSLVILLPVALLGTGLPSLIAAATERCEDLRARAGSLVFWNTLGSSAGGFVTAYLLLPGLGLTGTLVALGLGSLAMAAAAEWSVPATSRGAALRGWLRRPGYVLSALSLVAALAFARHDVTRRTLLGDGPPARIDDARLGRVVEGPLTTAYVIEANDDLYVAAGNVILAHVRHDGASTQAIQGHLPALFYPAPGTPERCLGIALGSGQSFGALLTYPVGELDVVDISPEMVALSLDVFAPYNHGLGTDDRVTIWLDDGRHFVDRAADASYDVVSMEPPPPTAEGVFALYSVEFYRGVDRILRDRGVFMQWLPLYLVTPLDLRGLLTTQAAVFPHTFVIKAGAWDFMIVSFKGDAAPRFDPAWIAERVRTFGRERLLSRWAGAHHDTASPMGVAALLISGPDDIAGIEPRLLYHDDDQRLSYGSGDREILRRYRDDRARVARLSFSALPLTPFRELARYFVGGIPVEQLDEERARGLGHFGVPSPRLVRELERRFTEAATPVARARVALSLALLHDERRAKRDSLLWIGRALEAHPGEDAAASLDAVRQVVRNDVATYAPIFDEWLRSLDGVRSATPLALAMRAELEAHRRRDAERRTRYLLR